MQDDQLSRKYRDAAFVGRIGKLYIHVYTRDEGKTPHFHVINRDMTFDCLIKILEPEYYQHGSYTDMLSKRTIKTLMKFLESPKRSTRYIGTNWNNLIDLWNTSLNRRKVDMNHPMPDYTKLK